MAGGKRRPGGPRFGPPMGAMAREKAKDAKSTLKRLLKYIGVNKYLLFLLLFVVMLSTGFALAAPALQATAIDAITLEEGKLHVDFDTLYKTIALIAAVYLLDAVCSMFANIASARLSVNTAKTMRRDLFAKIESLPLKYIDSHHHGDIMSRMTNDVSNISNAISESVSNLFSGFLLLVGTLTIMLIYSWQLTIVSMLTLPLVVLVSSKLGGAMRKLFTRQQELVGELNGQVEENVTGYKTVVAFGHEKAAIEEFSQTSAELRRTSIRAQIFGGIMGPTMNFIGNIGFLLIAAAGGYMAIGGLISVGVIQAFISYQRRFNRPISQLANQYASIQTALAGAERVFDIMDQPPEVNEGKIVPQKLKGDIVLDNVYFSYKEGTQVLKGMNLHVLPGQKIAIVGATGAGKTTIVNLLTRFYEIDSGKILIDGTDIRDIELSELRRKIAIVLQDTVLFSETIGYNIRYGRLDATDEEVRAAAKAANADIFIERLPEGYDTPLSESGANLSGGQRQLLSIARAVLADPDILILDEATSSVDTKTEMNIQEAMIALMKNRTSLIIAHRLSTIRDADRIIVIDDGRIVESGNHDELLARRGVYYRLYQNQYAGIAI
jgi:ATP-binding cassette subfamily B multidrug efflux pump